MALLKPKMISNKTPITKDIRDLTENHELTQQLYHTRCKILERLATLYPGSRTHAYKLVPTRITVDGDVYDGLLSIAVVAAWVGRKPENIYVSLTRAKDSTWRFIDDVNRITIFMSPKLVITRANIDDIFKREIMYVEK